MLERLVKEIRKRPKTLAGTRKSKRRNLEDVKGDFNLQAHFLVEYKLSMLSARLEQTAKKIHRVCLLMLSLTDTNPKHLIDFLLCPA